MKPNIKITHAHFVFVPDSPTQFNCFMLTDQPGQVLTTEDEDIGCFIETTGDPELIEQIKAGNKPNAVPELQTLLDKYGIGYSEITDEGDADGMRRELYEAADEDEELEEKNYHKICQAFLAKALAA